MDKLVFNVDDFPFDIIDALSEAKAGRGQRKKGKHYADAISASDIEFDQIPDSAWEERYGIVINRGNKKEFAKLCEKYNNNFNHSAMYEWQIHIMCFNINKVPYAGTTHNLSIIGRTPDELCDFFSRLKVHMHGLTLIMFDHFFNVEYSYFKSILDFTDENGNVNIFAKSSRDILYASAMEGSIEFRDSFSLFNCSLKSATKGLPHEKVGGGDDEEEYDYSKHRCWFTPLDEDEIKYGLHDVWGLCEAVKQALDDHGDTIYSLPRTSQGYIRRDIQRIMYTWNKFTDDINDSYDFYQRVLTKSNRGGLTHANRFLANVTHKGPISILDISSSYPSTFMEKFPLHTFKPYNKKKYTFEDLKYLEKNGYAYVMVITMEDVELRDIFTPIPFLNTDKSYGLIGNEEQENGRITKCESLTLYVNDDDWYCIDRQYKAKNYYISELYYSKYEYLPRDLVNYVIDLYKKKCEYKDREGCDERGRSYASLYRAIKPKINGVFGEMDRRVLTDEVYIDPSLTVKERKLDFDNADYSETYDKENQKRCVKYRWGCYVCSKARRKLLDLVTKLSPPGQISPVLYCDTDSVYVLGDIYHMLDEINEPYIKLAKKFNAYADDIHGVTHYLGSWEIDKEKETPEYSLKMVEFKTLGAKKYAYKMCKTYKNSDKVEEYCVLTTAGVNKKKGSKYLDNNGGLDAFHEGQVFTLGKCAPVYNDLHEYGSIEVTDCYGNKGTVEITSNMTLRPVSYKLGFEKDYKTLLETIDEFLDRDENIFNQYGYYVAKGWIT